MAKNPEWLTLGEGYADVKLSRPLAVSGAKVEALRLREPTVRDQEVASEAAGSEASREIATLANLCEVTPDEIRSLSLRDYKRLQIAFMGFID